MYKLLFIVFAVACLVLAVPVTAQQQRAAYGPVVRAFLIGLDEEVSELEFMIRHQEIGREDYERTKQRLTVRRRFIERTAARSREDRVPDLQVLTDDELSALLPGLPGLPGGGLQPDELQLGAQVGGRWKLVAIERVRNRFFVLEKLPQMEVVRGVPERKLGRGIDPRDVIETIVIHEEARHEEPGEKSQLAQQSRAETSFPPIPAVSAKESVPSVRKESRERGPRLLHIYLPEYTDKAREKKIEGELVVRALLQRDGKIKNIKIEKGLGYGLDDRAVTAVKRLGFLPAEEDGREVDAMTQIVFDFKMEKVTVHLAGPGAAESAKGAK